MERPQTRSARKPKESPPLEIGQHTIWPGQACRIEIPVARLPTQIQVSIPAVIIHGKRPGPSLALSAAIHGDEVNGVEIIRRMVPLIDPLKLCGTVMAVPVVNVFGFISDSRYLPDRRDLNRSFPGSPRGSLAARLANLFMTEIIAKCTHAIDFHTATSGRTNLPQVRANLRDADTRKFAEAFGAPAVIHSQVRDGSLREAAMEAGCIMLLYEGGETNRFNEDAVRCGVRGIQRAMAYLRMLPRKKASSSKGSVLCMSSTWVRAPRSGILRLFRGLGDRVAAREELGEISNIFGDRVASVRSKIGGVIIGASTNPLVNQGDAIVHVAT